MTEIIEKGTTGITRAQGAREARRIWKLLEENRLKSPLRPTVEVETSIKKAESFNPCGCICIFFAENGTCAVSGVGGINFRAALLALESMGKYVQERKTW